MKKKYRRKEEELERSKRKEKEKEDSSRKRNRGKRGKSRKDSIENDGKEYEVEVRRVGTGYRVYKEKEDLRRFDVGYSDRKEVKRPKGVEVVRDSKNTSRVVKANEERRKKPRGWVKIVVINTVASMEKVRKVSAYTGSGVRRSEKVGKRKRKSTKSTR